MSDFKHFSKIVNDVFTSMQTNNNYLYIVDISGDELYQAYLDAFPEGTNPIFRERTEHDCSCCKNFIRQVGSVVSISSFSCIVESIWDNYDVMEYPYNVVAKKLSELIKSKKVKSVFLSPEKKYGSEQTVEYNDTTKSTVNWNHFWIDIQPKFYSKSVGEARGRLNMQQQLFYRGLSELTNDALDTVIELIKRNSLYRGSEFLRSVEEFKQQKKNSSKQHDLELFTWKALDSHVYGFKNTVIGTLVSDLSNGDELEDAVRKFESKVAPENYKRPTSLITSSMIKQASQTLKELDLESAIERRHAVLSDVSVNNVLWADRQAKSLMKDTLEELLSDQVVKSSKVKVDNAIDIKIDDFMSCVASKASSIEAIIKNNQLSNFVSLTAPKDKDVNQLFKWKNDFGWSYNGNLADSSIKSKVKRAGGNVDDAQLRVSLAWFNTDDLDIHVSNGIKTIYFGNKMSFGGMLDVDMNAGNIVRDPVENVSWVRVPDGTYSIEVNQFRKRESIDVGFQIEIENQGLVQTFSYPKSVSGRVKVGTITVKDGLIVNSDMKIKSEGETFNDVWNVKTNTPVRVQTIMNSPNHWDDNALGNKHWFFMLENCKAEEKVRGFYNEFLKSDLEKHRKVFEILGDKMKCSETEDQLSGIGFSSTKKDQSLTVVVDGKKVYNINF